MYCGKCGRKLGPSGKCPVCDPSGKRKPKIWLVVFALILGIGILAAVWIYMSGRENSDLPVKSSVSDPVKTSKPAPTSVESPDDPISVFFRTEIAPNYPQPEEYFTVKYRGSNYWENGASQGYSGYYDVTAGPIALLGSSRADYNLDGIEDILIVSLNAVPFSKEELTKYSSNANGYCHLQLQTALYLVDEHGSSQYKDAAGNALPYQLDSWLISPCEGDVFEISNIGGRLVVCRAMDESTGETFSENGADFFNPLRGLKSHKDEVKITSFGEAADRYEYGARRTIQQTANNTQSYLTEYAEKAGSKEEWQSLQNEEKAYRKIATSLRGIYGLRCENFGPSYWRMRWANTFLSGETSNGLICYVHVSSYSTDWGYMSGETEFYLETISDPQPGIPELTPWSFLDYPKYKNNTDNILARTMDLSKKWSYASQYRVYPNDSEKYYEQNFRACFTFYDDETFDLLIYEPYSDVFFSRIGSYQISGENVEFMIYSYGKKFSYLYRFDTDALTLTQLSEAGIGNSFSEKGTVHQLEEDPFMNG